MNDRFGSFCPLTYKIVCHKADCQKVESRFFTKFNYHVALSIIWQYTKLYEYPKLPGTL